MSNPSSLSLPLFLALGAGALLGLSAATQKDRLPAIGGAKPSLEGAQPLPVIEIAFGTELAAAGGRLRDTVGQVPQAIREHLGFGPAQMVFKEDIDLAATGYSVRLRGLPVAGGTVEPDRLLALKTLGVSGGELAGEKILEPVTGRQGVWITEQDAGQARLLGYDVIEPGFILALHIDTVLRRHLHELLTREETYRLLDRAKQSAPRTVEELISKLEVGLVQKVLQTLLREQVSLRDLPMVLELMSDAARQSQDPATLTETVRVGLARQLSAALASDESVLHVLPLGPRWEQLRNAQPQDQAVRDLVGELRRQIDSARNQGIRPVLVAPRELRAQVRRLIERELPDLPVLSEHEVDPAFRLEPVTTPMAGVK